MSISSVDVNSVDSSGFKPDVIIIEFLEVSFHQLLYIHQIYPSGIFSRKQKYGIPVQVSGHPLVNNYITHCLKTAHELLKLQTLSTVMLVFCGNNNHDIIKKIVFDISGLQRDIQLSRVEVSQLESALRDVFLRLSLSDRHLTPLPKGCTFKIMLATQEHGHITLANNSSLLINQTFPWTKSNDHHVVNPQVVPLTSLDACGVFMQIFAEEIPRNIENELHTPKI